MKKLALISLFLVQCFLLAAQPEKTPYLTRSLSGESLKFAMLETSGGSILVNGVSASEARLEVYVYPNNSKDRDISKEEIKKRLEEHYDLKIEVSNNKLTAIAKHKERNIDWRNTVNVAFKLYVPRNIDTKLATSGGSISLANLEGKQDFATSGGGLDLDNLSGEIDGVTSGGSINLENSKGTLDLTTSGGGITARKSEGRIRLSTSGGSLDLRDLGGDIRASTSGGGINGENISGDLVATTSGGSIDLRELTCSLEASTSAGSIRVRMNSLNKHVRLSNSAGNVDLEIPAGKGVDLDLSGGSIRTDNMQNFSGKIEDDQIDGKLNGGGVLVKVRTSSGRIRLNLK